LAKPLSHGTWRRWVSAHRPCRLPHRTPCRTGFPAPLGPSQKRRRHCAREPQRDPPGVSEHCENAGGLSLCIATRYRSRSYSCSPGFPERLFRDGYDVLRHRKPRRRAATDFLKSAILMRCQVEIPPAIMNGQCDWRLMLDIRRSLPAKGPELDYLHAQLNVRIACCIWLEPRF
jgi:hypothetical protein